MAEAANTCTSSTGTVSGTDPNFILTQKINNPEGAVLYVKYTIGTSVSMSITFDFINSIISTTDKYRSIDKTGTTMSAYTLTVAATGNFRIPFSVLPSEKTVAINITFGSATKDGVIVANIIEA